MIMIKVDTKLKMISLALMLVIGCLSLPVAAHGFPFKISGNVRTSSGLAVKNVELHGSLTDTNGFYAIGNLKEGKYLVRPSKPGYSFIPDFRVVYVGPDKTDVNFITKESRNSSSVSHPDDAWITGEDVVNESLTGKDIRDGSITGDDIEDGSIGSEDIKDDSLTGEDIEDGSITSNDIEDGSLTSDDIEDESITSVDIEDGSLTTDDIEDNSLTSDDVADGSLTSVDIEDGSLTSDDIEDDSITTNDIQDDSLTGDDVADGSLTSDDIEDGTLTSDDVEDGSLTSIDIEDGSLTSDDIEDESITSTDIEDGSLTSDDIQDNSLTTDDIEDDSITSVDIEDGSLTSDDVADDSLTSDDIQDGSITSVDIEDESITGEDIEDQSIDLSDLSDEVLLAFGADSEINLDFWRLTGNSDTEAGTNFLGTTDDQPIELHVKGQRAFRIEPTMDTPNLIGGSNQLIQEGIVGTTISGGSGHNSSGDYSTIGGGFFNEIGADTVGFAGGIFFWGSAEYSTIGGGYGNSIGGDYATIGGGSNNSAEGSYSTIPGGYRNMANANNSFALGTRVVIDQTHTGAFVYSDAKLPMSDFHSQNDNEFAVRARGGFRFVTGTNASGTGASGLKINPGASSWSYLSDLDGKTNFNSVDTTEVLAQLVAIPIRTWNYKTQDPSIRHIGPVAQDFYSAFNIGNDDRHISTVDADGVALAAIQGLHQKLVEAEEKYAKLQRQNDNLQERLLALEAAIGKIERSASTAAYMQQ